MIAACSQRTGLEICLLKRVFTCRVKPVLIFRSESFEWTVETAALQKRNGNKKEESKRHSTGPGASECVVVSNLLTKYRSLNFQAYTKMVGEYLPLVLPLPSSVTSVQNVEVMRAFIRSNILFLWTNPRKGHFSTEAQKGAGSLKNCTFRHLQANI